MPVADYSVHSEATLEGALAALRRILFHRDQQHTTWPDEANLALGQFADLIREVKSYREQAIEAVELTQLGESVVAAAGETGGAGLGGTGLDRGTGFQPVSGSSGFQPERDPGDETDEAGLPDEIPFGTPRSPATDGASDRTLRQGLAVARRLADRRLAALQYIYSMLETHLESADFVATAFAPHILDGIHAVCDQAIAYNGVEYTVANPRPESV